MKRRRNCYEWIALVLAGVVVHVTQAKAEETGGTINSWNEWTEGSYLEPDTQHKMSYLEAVKAVFPPK